MRKCTKCKVEKTEDEFRKGKRVNWCRSCFQEYEKAKWKACPERRRTNKEKSKERRRRNRDYVLNYLSTHPCVSCGNPDFRVLEFDHIDRSIKTNNVSDLSRTACGLHKIQEEIDKCQVLCANCHRIKTFENQDWNRV